MKRIRRIADRPDKEGAVCREMSREYKDFRNRMLMKPSAKVYKKSRKICFYESINEFMEYQEKLDVAFLDAASGREDIIAELWEMYLKNEYMDVATWDGIREILAEYVRRHRRMGDHERQPEA